MIRDRIVCGIRDKKVSERLQLETELTLEKAVNTARQAETIKKQQETFKNTSSTYGNANRVSAQRQNVNRGSKSRPKEIGSSQSVEKQSGLCYWCGKQEKHGKQKCPAQKAVCNKCKKIGHYAKVCKTKKYVNELDEEKKEGFLGSIRNEQSSVKNFTSNKWHANVVVGDTSLDFKIDTGADVTVVPYKLYEASLNHIKLQPTSKTIYGPSGGKLIIAGVFQEDLQAKDCSFSELIYVVHKLEHPLLSCKASEGLNLIQRVCKVESSIDPLKEFPMLFKGIGKVEKPYQIKLKLDAKPYAIAVPRRVPLPLKTKLKKKLQEMVMMDVIESVDEATDWCAPMVIVPKKSGDIRICVDLTVLNENIEREYFPMASVDYTLSQFENAKVFSIIDANAGFWQIALEPESSNLTTFITPFGRYKFKRLPFGIKTAPEIFQKRIRETVQDRPGVVGLMDEFVIFGETEDEHDKRLRDVLNQLQKAGWTLNAEKCMFRKKSVTFLGHIISGEGIKPDPKKTEAIAKIPRPNNVKELKRFLGMAGFLNKFIPNMAEEANPLYQLLRQDVEWMWSLPQERSFQRIKDSLCQTPGLAMYDSQKETFVSSDASSYGLGAVLYQSHDGKLRPVCYASRTLSEVEKRYAQIEKEALAIVWACERFHDYIVGIKINIETDHKPLVPILMMKPLDSLTPRLQRIKLRMMRYDYTVRYIPGKDLIPADTLSRSPLPEEGEEELSEEIAAYVQMIVNSFPASDKRLAEIWSSQQDDRTCQILAKYCSEGWPEKQHVPCECQRYWEHRNTIVLQDGLLLKDARILIPEKFRGEILNRLHEGHQGITKCRAKARESVWWPGLSTEIEKLISNCYKCIQQQKYHKEPLMPSSFPERPWQIVGADLLKLKSHWYLIVADYYSRFFETAKLEDLTSLTVINHMKSMFARHGIPETVRSDNGSQFSQKIADAKYKKFSENYGFSIITSSPKYAQSNGFIESMVKDFKQHFMKSESEDPYMMLLALRSTPLENGFSPAELLMGRQLRTKIPSVGRQLMPRIPDQVSLRKKERDRIEKQKFYFDRRHGARELPSLKTGQPVWISDMRTYGEIKSAHQAPRSYLVETPRGVLRRNRAFLHPSPIPESFREEETPPEVNTSGQTEVRNDPERHMSEEARRPDYQSQNPVDERQSTSDKELSSVSPYKTRSGRSVHAPLRLNL